MDTLRHFRAEMPDAELFFITGADAVIEILEWKDPAGDPAAGDPDRRDAARLSPGPHARQECTSLLEQDRVRVMEIPCIGVSSSLIRERVRPGPVHQVPRSRRRREIH